ncbi:hypothetical protein EPUS_06067 [Endocarpon pusillum Z07020]|uniref:Uncharacterized protein n=1 Tax=Endocarpon pusillum (strain Z07020 / HMAS-L-300199) TaxID=1263415 RepID=U1GJU3_ENDPU|nr:uncharacterized protein EPUS_06067 [Endocarpon pusillum Z07020]ERF72438.1 hypothetical protein EPUS_06067 [Endocarpon pusillum Z07020]
MSHLIMELKCRSIFRSNPSKAFTMIPMMFLLFKNLVAHAKPLPADLDNLPVPPDFMTARQCPEDRPLIDCFHPHFGLVYGPQADKAIYRAKPGIGSALKAGQTSNAAKVISPLGSTQQCVFIHGACHEIPGISGLAKDIPAEATGEHTKSGHKDDRENDREDHNESHGEDDGEEISCSSEMTAADCQKVELDKHISNSATANPDKELAAAPSDEDAVRIDTKTLTKRRAGLKVYYMDCGDHSLTSYCYAYPRNYYCGSLGIIINSVYDWRCEDNCRCPYLGPPPLPEWCLETCCACRKLENGSFVDDNAVEPDAHAAAEGGGGTVDGGWVIPNGNLTAMDADATATAD